VHDIRVASCRLQKYIGDVKSDFRVLEIEGQGVDLFYAFVLGLVILFGAAIAGHYCAMLHQAGEYFPHRSFHATEPVVGSPHSDYCDFHIMFVSKRAGRPRRFSEQICSQLNLTQCAMSHAGSC